MTLQQEAYNKIDQLSDDNVRFVIQLIDKIQQGGTNEEATSSRQKKEKRHNEICWKN
jgi:BRCT domain type II-containing protein